jgi:hypothetical protein
VTATATRAPFGHVKPFDDAGADMIDPLSRAWNSVRRAADAVITPRSQYANPADGHACDRHLMLDSGNADR